jgi:general stress protein YciG
MSNVYFFIETIPGFFYIRRCQYKLTKEVYMADNTSDRGLGSPNMSEEDKQAIHSMGDQSSQSNQSSSGKFEKGSTRANRAGKKGGQQSTNR